MNSLKTLDTLNIQVYNMFNIFKKKEEYKEPDLFMAIIIIAKAIETGKTKDVYKKVKYLLGVIEK
jgi:hypothetical protein